ncbi:branched-chain amino acid transporter permease [Bisgaard Taxon 10/6]|uniref:Branched-chain amino acid transporter permease n=1 Tax=Exercitatus varius TaxID=67857 RepID=A0AAW6Q7L8_9PAST|nr:branched-chain amino acid transporter permease [Exercitatus varius]MDG2918022.1 branched-chain amino acid transporter permease [Exercitatus varius]MDG2949554.1 branched-chain amino acid transporter permease [Exercitatus varius]MDG2951112.1 branched-chain amino acid transporter permease [Exercitatus varius]MDG2955232.1 branched-chain amino acid transporter permease [Exercitatus varius]MDG2963514.1 branched-chain amino acid transporter permease [Exercitatus varius]
MTLSQQIITIAMGVVGVHFCRLLPFWIFPANRPIPHYIRYLGKVLPAAMFGMLVIYCFKDIDLFTGYHGIPNFIAGAVTLALHLWKKNMFLSMAAGTILYMILVQQVFVAA